MVAVLRVYFGTVLGTLGSLYMSCVWFCVRDTVPVMRAQLQLRWLRLTSQSTARDIGRKVYLPDRLDIELKVSCCSRELHQSSRFSLLTRLSSIIIRSTSR